MEKLPPDQLNELIIKALKASQDGVGVYDQNDIMLFCNDTVARIMGYEGREAIGRSFEENLRHSWATGSGVIADDGDVDGMVRRAKESMKTQGFSTFESDTVTGEWNQVSRLKTEAGHTFMYSTDITQLKNTEKALKDALRYVKKLAATDALTGISNRRHFMDLANKEFNRSKRYGHPLSILALDIDHFKSINDNYGHQAGDKVLESISACCQSLLCATDVFGRLGGEEFSILLPEANTQSAQEMAQRVLDSVANLSVEYEGKIITFTTSIGISEVNDDCKSLEALMQHSDQALYQAKHNGRNRMELHKAK
jgi:diguanylate cyclase (GGDEF)-like protein/PAS domain S-box-containing protein